MCGIIGYIGNNTAPKILTESLKKLEYRGYDSTGIALLDNNSRLVIVKASGTVNNFKKKLDLNKLTGKIGIGHTRWATHGEPNNINAHPHTDCNNKISIVHNGIIENHQEIRHSLEKSGHKFLSQTDSECISHLIEEYLNNNDDIEKAIRHTANTIQGANVVVIIHKEHPNKLFCFKVGSAGGLIIGNGNNEMFVSSDIPAIIPYTSTVTYLSTNEIAIISSEKVEYKNLEGISITKKTNTIEINRDSISKGEFKHYMLKEIHDQPQAITDTIGSRVSFTDNKIKFEKFPFTNQEIKEFSKIILIGMGTSLHACMVAKNWFESITRIPTEVDNSSEFRYRDIILNEKSLIISISQSGETADTIAAMEKFKSSNSKQITLSNSPKSQTSQIADYTIDIRAGLEIGVASTKTFMCSLTTLYLLSLFLGEKRNSLEKTKITAQLSELAKLPRIISNMLDNQNQYKIIAKKYYPYSNFLYLGRGLNYPLAMEGALKLKEISYIHAEGYPAGEMKHGPIALIDQNMPVVVLIPKDKMLDKMLINLNEVKARNGTIIAITTENTNYIENLANDIIFIPKTSDELIPIIMSIPMQLISYHIALNKKCNIDMPRNLAKSVTVE
ncbi:MAG: glutamine--fructose-6-phosphate transaminase (isomerizing) [Chloroflexi bacterium]|nr:glutamine--fructose-6-phosphate transaminase (isomerizing) [Chloroflexota bacterium]|tara:strand:- start:28493 stop:30337 length:1845 start_codon:yes stop_codon:yes gene_type:complete